MKQFFQNGLLFCFIGIFVVFPIVYIIELLAFPEFQLLKEALENEKSIILFGSSVNEHYAIDDKDKRSISELLDAFLPGHNVVGISHGAYQSDIYLEFVKYIARSGKKPIIIVPINLRYFSPEWDLRPEYQFNKEKNLLNGYPFIVNLKSREINESEFNNSPIYNGNEYVGKVLDFRYIPNKAKDRISEMSKGFVFHYMQPLKANHQKLKSLFKICEIGNENDLKIIMYITPIDYTYAEKLGIKKFRQQQHDNIYIIKSTLTSCETVLIDLSMTLNSSYFDHGNRPGEHLNIRGRLRVARALKTAINKTISP